MFVQVKNEKVSAADELTVETSSDKPGWIHIQVWAKDVGNRNVNQPVNVKGKKVDRPVSGGIGAMVEPEKLLPPMKEPDDFDAFWNQVKAELAAVPMKELAENEKTI